MFRSRFVVLSLVLGALTVLLIRIEQPFVDPWSWRQSDVAAIARNYLENGFRFAHPQVDWTGDTPGYVGTEFPILPFSVALCYKLTGVQDWVGRVQSVLFFVGALPFFFLLVRRLYGEVAAIWAAFFYAFAPLSIITSRAFMPDVPSLSLAIVGTYFFSRWVEQKDKRGLFISAAVMSLAFLIKITAMVIGPILLFFLVADRGKDWAVSKTLVPDGGSATAAPWWARFAQWELWVWTVTVLVPSAIWYWHAYRISTTYYPYHFFGGGGFRIMNAAWYWKIAKETVLSSLTPPLFLLAVLGVFMVPRKKYRWVFHWWLASMLAFVFLAGWGNRHQWYQLPFVPIAAAFAGCFCQWLAQRFRSNLVLLILGAVLIVTAFGVGSYRASLPFYQSTAAPLRNAGLELKEATTPEALIVAADGGNPAIFYYAHRKGWHFIEDGLYQGPPVNSAQAIADLEKLRQRGASHLVFTSNTHWWLEYYPEFAGHLSTSTILMEETPEFTIYKLEAATQ